jgi:hypothetical protein
MPKISTSFSSQLRSFRQDQGKNIDPYKIDAMTNLILVLPVRRTTSAIFMRIEEERFKVVNEISGCLKRNHFSDGSIKKFRRNINIIIDYYIRGAYLIDCRMTSFARRYNCSRAKRSQAAISLRIKCIAQAEIMYEEVHLRLGQLDNCALESRFSPSMASLFIPRLLEESEKFAEMIIQKKLTWQPPKGTKYPLCARSFDVKLL